MSYKFRGYQIPERMMRSIDSYLRDRLQPGGFLSAVICNDLTSAVFYADDENLKNLPAFVSYFYNEADSRAWGSREKMIKWMSSEEV